MKKRLAVMLFVGLAVLLLDSYSNASDDYRIIVKSGIAAFDGIAEKGEGGAELVPSDERLFQTWMNTHSEIPYVKIGDKITITAHRDLSGSYAIRDVLLKKDGSLKYRTQPSIEPSLVTEIQFDQGVGSIVLTEDRYASLSSQSTDYEPGATIRGFKLYLGDTQETIVFVIRTDAESSLEQQVVFHCISAKPS
ncbi:hypothetical protein D3P07_02700 [Paenibacillus sp. 1011MAR3C5]|uniref:hypothetical protein n=1 Tax=Paenibacillus sp. 1011MAR3C5 TaxID=1675787 RepID=UPI000E6C8E6C|nr:hypothetical protein [Paenibacillus sp. 1011MAR3C5]RJE91001.1 hypothetical protein D3P07_02700 [Paenibacillus sp. 1011MAR3C5]